MRQEILYIDEVRSSDVEVGGLDIDAVGVELFGKEESIAEVETNQGLRLNIENIDKDGLIDGALLYANGKLVAQLHINPSICICYEIGNVSEIADFCYYVGNRHLPLFVHQDQTSFRLPYDEKIFNQLNTKFPERISKQEIILEAKDQIRNVYSSQN